jgi:hypothetical protein
MSRNDPVDLILLISLGMPVMLGTVIAGKLSQIFFQHFVAEPHFTYDSYRKVLVYSTLTHIHTHSNK